MEATSWIDPIDASQDLARLTAERACKGFLNIRWSGDYRNKDATGHRFL